MHAVWTDVYCDVCMRQAGLLWKCMYSVTLVVTLADACSVTLLSE